MNITFQLFFPEARELRRQARSRKVAVATVARRLVLRHFGVTMIRRKASGPRAGRVV